MNPERFVQKHVAPRLDFPGLHLIVVDREEQVRFLMDHIREWVYGGDFVLSLNYVRWKAHTIRFVPYLYPDAARGMGVPDWISAYPGQLMEWVDAINVMRAKLAQNDARSA